MKNFDLNALGVQELAESQLIGINGGGPVEEFAIRLFILIVDFLKTMGPYIIQENCERATSDTYQPYADLGHR
jgi:hypothetical protein